jgi:shikimate dehydrogenase
LVQKYLVIGNPIEHSLSPKLHNFWFKKNNINASYDKKLIIENELESFFSFMKKNNVAGVNVTVPFKQKVIPFLDKISDLSIKAGSVNTVVLDNGELIGDNTDIIGFQNSLKKFDLKGKKALIFGAGGVVSSVILGLNNLGLENITITNRTKNKAKILSEKYNLEVCEWGKILNVDVYINCTSIGLDKNDSMDIDFSKINGKIFYDIIYKPKTNFLINAEKYGNQIIDGKMMFLYQAQKSFEIWHGIKPKICERTQALLND